MIRTMTHRKYDLMIALAIGLAAGPLRAATLVVNNLGDTDVRRKHLHASRSDECVERDGWVVRDHVRHHRNDWFNRELRRT